LFQQQTEEYEVHRRWGRIALSAILGIRCF